MADISKITLPSGSSYDIKDSWARDKIATIESGSVVWCGLSTGGKTTESGQVQPITDGSTFPFYVVNNITKASVQGNMIAYIPSSETLPREFIFDGTTWQEIGGMGLLKALAYKDSVSGSTGYTPAGGVSKPTFTGTEGDVTVNGTPSGTVTVSVGNGTANYTPAGSNASSSVSFAAHTTKAVVDSVTPTSKKLTTTSIPNVTAVGTKGSAASWSASVSNETLTFSWTANTPTTVPTLGTAIIAATGGLSETTATTNVGATIVSSVDSTKNTSPITALGAGTAAAQKFTGTGAELKAEFTGNNTQSTGKYTPAGEVSKPTFTGTASTISITST